MFLRKDPDCDIKTEHDACYPFLLLILSYFLFFSVVLLGSCSVCFYCKVGKDDDKDSDLSIIIMFIDR